MKSSSLSKKPSTIDRDGRVGNVQLLALGTNPWGFSDGVSALNVLCLYDLCDIKSRLVAS